jgi:hypothetical protein
MNGKVILACRCHTRRNADPSRTDLDRWNVFDRTIRSVNFILDFFHLLRFLLSERTDNPSIDCPIYGGFIGYRHEMLTWMNNEPVQFEKGI